MRKKYDFWRKYIPLSHLDLHNVGVDGDGEQHAVLGDEDHVEEELAHQGGHVLQRLGPRQQQRVHPEQLGI